MLEGSGRNAERGVYCRRAACLSVSNMVATALSTEVSLGVCIGMLGGLAAPGNSFGTWMPPSSICVVSLGSMYFQVEMIVPWPRQHGHDVPYSRGLPSSAQTCYQAVAACLVEHMPATEAAYLHARHKLFHANGAGGLIVVKQNHILAHAAAGLSRDQVGLLL